MPSISVVITTCNEAEYVDECLQSVAWADEIIVVDLESTDNTVEVSQRYTEKIYTHPRVPVVELVRDFGIQKATQDWVLVLDPDERVTELLAQTLRTLANEGDAAAYEIPRTTLMFGYRVNGAWKLARHIRFFRRGVVQWPGEVHSRPVVDGVVKALALENGSIEHLNYTTISQFIEKLNRYTTAEATRLRDAGRPFHWLKLFYQPSKEFYRYYLKSGGYKDGLLGLMISLMMVFYSQAAYIKLWEMYDKEKRNSDDDA